MRGFTKAVARALFGMGGVRRSRAPWRGEKFPERARARRAGPRVPRAPSAGGGAHAGCTRGRCSRSRVRSGAASARARPAQRSPGGALCWPERSAGPGVRGGRARARTRGNAPTGDANIARGERPTGESHSSSKWLSGSRGGRRRAPFPAEKSVGAPMWRAHVARGRARRRLTRAPARARRGRGARPGRSGGGAGATRLTLRAHPHAHTPSNNHGHGPLQARARRHRRGVHVCAPAPVCVARTRAELSKLSCGGRVARLARSRRSRGGVVAS